MTNNQYIGSRSYLLRRLHGAIKEYHPELTSAQVHETARNRASVDSLKNATDEQLYKTIIQLESEFYRSPRARPKAKTQKPTRGEPRGPMAEISKKQINFINDLRPRVPGMDNDPTFKKWVAKKFHFVVNPDKLELLTNGQGQQIIGGLKAMADRTRAKGLRPKGGPPSPRSG